MPKQRDGEPIDRRAVAAAADRMLPAEGERVAREVLDALCDPTRLKIVRALQRNTLAASDVARVIGRSRAATSQHLKVLRDVRAVEATRSGNVVRYRLSDRVTAAILDDIASAFDRLEEKAG